MTDTPDYTDNPEKNLYYLLRLNKMAKQTKAQAEAPKEVSADATTTTQAPAAPAAPQPEPTDQMNFTPQDPFEEIETGEFTIAEVVPGSTFEGVYNGESFDHPLTDREGNPKSMLEFYNDVDGRVLFNNYYQMNRHFVNRESKTPVEWERPILWRVDCIREEETKSGDKVKVFAFKMLYLDSEAAEKSGHAARYAPVLKKLGK